jgi:hypothetical protein
MQRVWQKQIYVFPGTVKAEACKTFPEAAPNTTDIDSSLKLLKSNDPSLVELNLNNIKVGCGSAKSGVTSSENLIIKAALSWFC